MSLIRSENPGLAWAEWRDDDEGLVIKWQVDASIYAYRGRGAVVVIAHDVTDITVALEAVDEFVAAIATPDDGEDNAAPSRYCVSVSFIADSDEDAQAALAALTAAVEGNQWDTNVRGFTLHNEGTVES